MGSDQVFNFLKNDTIVIRCYKKIRKNSRIIRYSFEKYHPQIIITINPWANHHGIPNGWFASGPAESASHNNCRALASSPFSSKAASKARKVTSPSVAQGQAEENMAVCQNRVPLVNIKIAGKWMFIPLKMVLIGIDPYPTWGKLAASSKDPGPKQRSSCFDHNVYMPWPPRWNKCTECSASHKNETSTYGQWSLKMQKASDS